jgi:hypothetical protein
MSLTSSIKHPRVRSALDDLLRSLDWPRSLPAPLLVPRRPGVDPRLAGTAFDYAIRFELGRKYPEVEESGWVAEHAPFIMEQFGSSESRTFRAWQRVTNARTFLRKHRKRMRPGASWFRRLATHCLKLAHLDFITRDPFNWLASEFSEPSPDAVEDIVQLLAKVPLHAFEGRRVLLNPAFGQTGARLVGGADADLMVDDHLIDWKVTQDLVIRRDMVRQLLGYVLLCDQARKDGEPLPQLNKGSLYFARHARLVTLDFVPLRNEPTFPHRAQLALDLMQRAEEEAAKQFEHAAGGP